MPLPLDPRRSVLPLLLQHHRAWFTIVAYECRYRCACREVLLKDPSLVELRTDAQVVVVGDLHGQYQDLQRIFERLGRPGSDPKVWVFLGDYIDGVRRGMRGCGVQGAWARAAVQAAMVMAVQAAMAVAVQRPACLPGTLGRRIRHRLCRVPCCAQGPWVWRLWPHCWRSSCGTPPRSSCSAAITSAARSRWAAGRRWCPGRA